MIYWYIFILALAVEQMVMIAKSDISDMDKSIAINLKDMKFHEYIWEKSESQRRVKILRDIFFQLRMAMLWDMDETGDLYVSATDHYEIIDSLKSKDLEKCKRALKEHIISYKEGKFN